GHMKLTSYVRALAALAAASASCVAQPNFTTQLQDQTANQGFNARFFAVASSTNPPLNYRWYFNSNIIAGVNNTLTVTNAQAINAGSYFVVASDSSGSVTSTVARLTVVAPAVLDPKLSANVRVGEDPLTLPADSRSEGEPHIARSFRDPNLLLAAFQEGISASTGYALTSSYCVSTNGGWTWTRDYILGASAFTGGPYRYSADDIAGIDADDNLYVA